MVASATATIGILERLDWRDSTVNSQWLCPDLCPLGYFQSPDDLTFGRILVNLAPNALAVVKIP